GSTSWKRFLMINEVISVITCELIMNLDSTIYSCLMTLFCFFITATAATDIYTLSLHDALPIYRGRPRWPGACLPGPGHVQGQEGDRKSTRLNSSHVKISYAVFCLKKKNGECRQLGNDDVARAARAGQILHLGSSELTRGGFYSD